MLARRLCLLGLLPSFLVTSVSAQPAIDPAEAFVAQYSDLAPEQKRLVDDWTERFSKTVKQQAKPADVYANMSLSAKTTFNAITHALLKTTLTDQNGASLGPAIQIVDKVDRLAGKVNGAPGDQQFRIYIELKPGAMDLLSKSREFSRGPDNTVFHKGYPICFRSKPFVPSIQVSIARDGKAADIDVDYRSSKFPIGLVNGHLTASNSDVRAGNNDERHNNRWDGLPNWWRNLLGLPIADDEKEVKVLGVTLKKTPKKMANVKPEEAVRDFLSSWLVERKPEDAMTYLDPNVYYCMDLEQGKRTDRGMAPFAMLKALQALNKSFGTVPDLSQVSTGVPLTGARVKIIPQPYEPQFVLYDVREDLAEQSKCINKIDDYQQASPKALKSDSFGKYVGAVFQLTPKGQKGQVVATLWAKKDDFWKLISYDVEPEFDKLALPDLRTAIPQDAPLEQVAGDPEMIRVAGEFMKDWFTRGKIERAAQSISPRCYECVGLYQPDEVPPAKDAKEARKMLIEGMKRAADSAGKPKDLNAAIVAAEPHHSDFKLVKHAEEKSFVIVSLPDEMAELIECSARVRGAEIDGAHYAAVTARTYGSYYGTGFSLARGGDDAAVLWIVWAREGGQWKAVSYVILTS